MCKCDQLMRIPWGGVVRRCHTLLFILLFFSGVAHGMGQAGVPVKVSAKEQIRGDVNGDGLVNMSDVTCVINYILGKVDNYPLGAVDVNGDGLVNMSDVTVVINIILGRGGNHDDDTDGPPVDDGDANPNLPVLAPRSSD